MARPLATLLKEASQIKNSDMLNEQQKTHALSMLQREIDAATGQMALALTGGVPPAPQAPAETTQTPPKKS